MKYLFFVALLLSPRLVQAISKNIELQVGEQTLLKRDFKGSVTVTNPKIVKVDLVASKVRLVGKKPGVAHLFTKSGETTVCVYSSKIATLREKLVVWLAGVPTLKMQTLPQKLILTGEVYRVEDWHKIYQFKNQFPLAFENDATLAAPLGQALKSKVESALASHSIVSTQVHLANGQVRILSSGKGREESGLIKKISQEWGLAPPEASHNLELRPMIEIDIIIAEMKKSSEKNLGLQLPGSYSATILPAGDLSSVTTTFDGITPQLHALFTEGLGKVLANPRLLCRSGEAAHFVAGGQIPLKIRSIHAADVLWKSYGVILDIFPTADLNEGISTKLVTEVSLLDEAHKIDGVPGLLTNRIETTFDLRGTKTIALSGLIKSEIGKSSTSTPLLGEIPILGELFKSHDYKENRTELIVFVTPRIISPENPPEPPALPNWNETL